MTEQIKLSDLQPDHRNANKGTERGAYMVEQSLRKLGAGRSILLDKNGKIIAGNKTAEAAAAIDLDDVQVVRTDGKKLVAVMREDLDLDDDTGLARELAYADNRTGQVSLEFDPDVIAADLDMGVDLGDWFQDFELEEIGAMPDEPLEEGDAEPQISRADELQEEWGVELGQMWRLPSRVEGQEHRLICGDCTDAAAVDRVMGGEKADMMLTSPPYNSKAGGIRSDYYKPQDKSFYIDKSTDLKTETEWVEFCDAVMNLFSSISASDKSVIVWNVMYNANMRGGYGRHVFGNGHNFSVKETICWNKGGGFNIATKGIMSRNWELVFVMSEGDEYETTQGEYETRYNMWNIGTENTQEKGVHNAAFPVGFSTKSMEWFSFQSYKIYEPFSGSGTTIIAAENLSRQCRAVEISPAYVAVALQRYKDAFGIEPELMST